MGALDEPERFTFMRNGKDPRRQTTEAAAAWVSTAVTPEQKLQNAGLLEAQKRLNRHKQRNAAATAKNLKPGLTRGGKALPDSRDDGGGV